MLRRDSVLVVDQKTDTAEVLQAVFEPKGIEVCRVRRWLDTDARQVGSIPSVVVWDADSTQPDASPNERIWAKVPRVIIGRLRLPAGNGHDDAGQKPETRYLGKPFEYAELMRAIESLISAPQQPVISGSVVS